MKSLFIILLIIFTFCKTSAQVKNFAPLSCDTWGPDQFRNSETFVKDRVAYAWLPDDIQNEYINNVQLIRWNIADLTTNYTFTVTDIFDAEFYSVSGKNTCGLIIFPDSIKTTDEILFVKIKAADNKHLKTINFSSVKLRSRSKQERLAILKELQTCENLECKIEKLKSHKSTLDILSLLELEKMKDAQNKALDKQYWEFVSTIVYDFSHRSWER